MCQRLAEADAGNLGAQTAEHMSFTQIVKDRGFGLEHAFSR